MEIITEKEAARLREIKQAIQNCPAEELIQYADSAFLLQLVKRLEQAYYAKGDKEYQPYQKYPY